MVDEFTWGNIQGEIYKGKAHSINLLLPNSPYTIHVC